MPVLHSVINDPDADLVRLAQENDGQACEDLSLKYRRRVYSQAARILGYSGADDATQNVFFRVKKYLPGFRGIAKFSTWLYRVTYRECIRLLPDELYQQAQNQLFYQIHPIHNPLRPDRQAELRDQIVYYTEDMEHPEYFLDQATDRTNREIADESEENIEAGTVGTRMFTDRQGAKQKRAREEGE